MGNPVCSNGTPRPFPSEDNIAIYRKYIDQIKKSSSSNHWANFMQPNLAQSIPGRRRLKFLKVKDHLILKKDSLIQLYGIVIALRKCVY